MPPPSKPISVWLAQAAWVFGLFGAIYMLFKWGAELTPGGLAYQGVRAVVAGALIVGLQRRLQAAGWITAGLFTLSISWNAYVDLRLLMAAPDSGDQAGTLIGQLIGAALILMLPVRLVFGDPARSYFAGKPVRPPPSYEDS